MQDLPRPGARIRRQPVDVPGLKAFEQANGIEKPRNRLYCISSGRLTGTPETTLRMSTDLDERSTKRLAHQTRIDRPYARQDRGAVAAVRSVRSGGLLVTGP